MPKDPEMWTAERCAEHWGVSVSRWRGLVSEGRAPGHLPGFDPETGLRRWDAEAVREAESKRPGRGFRSDLHTKP